MLHRVKTWAPAGALVVVAVVAACVGVVNLVSLLPILGS